MDKGAVMDYSQASSHGIAAHGRHYVGGRVLAAWDELIDLATVVDLDRPTRVKGWRAREVCVQLGCWEDYDSFGAVLDSALAGGVGDRPDTAALHDRVTSSHREASREAVVGALVRNRQNVAEYFRTHPEDVDRAPGVVSMGRLPFLSIVHGQTFELATAALDLASAGNAPPSVGLLDTAMAALVDVTGALGTTMDLRARVAVLSDHGGWRLDIDEHGWSVTPATEDDRGEPHVYGPPDALVDAAAGRVNPVPKVARGTIRLHRLGGLLKVSPIAHEVPGLPGGASLSIAVRTIAGAGGAARWFRRGR
jgi:hypothetical protein